LTSIRGVHEQLGDGIEGGIADPGGGAEAVTFDQKGQDLNALLGRDPGEQREHPRQWLDQRREGRGNYLCVAAAPDIF
jgi:hypothetical protein